MAQAESRLREVGMRATSARIRVLATLLDAHSAMTHGELQVRLVGLDRVTLYRALDGLVTVGLAHRISGDDRAFRYGAGAISDHTSDLDHRHGHFKCTGCGKVFCLSHSDKKRALMDKLQKSLLGAVAPGFQSHNIELTVKGWCAQCAQSAHP